MGQACSRSLTANCAKDLHQWFKQRGSTRASLPGCVLQREIVPRSFFFSCTCTILSHTERTILAEAQ